MARRELVPPARESALPLSYLLAPTLLVPPLLAPTVSLTLSRAKPRAPTQPLPLLALTHPLTLLVLTLKLLAPTQPLTLLVPTLMLLLGVVLAPTQPVTSLHAPTQQVTLLLAQTLPRTLLALILPLTLLVPAPLT